MALNMTLNTLWETSLLSDDPWWLYLVYGAGWTISLAVASFALALTTSGSEASAKAGSSFSATFPSSSRSSSGTSSSPN